MRKTLIDTKERLTEFLGIPISPSLKSRLQRQADLEGRSDASMGRFAIEQYLKNKEQANDESSRAARISRNQPSCF